MWLFAILIVVALGVVAVVAAGKGEPLAPVASERPAATAPAAPGNSTGDPALVGDDVRRARFTLALRGYRMSEVDALLSRLAGELDAARKQSGQKSASSASTED